jgi:hypothetical protein
MNRYLCIVAAAAALAGIAACDSQQPAPKSAAVQVPAAAPEKAAPPIAPSADGELSHRVKSVLTTDQSIEVGGVEVAAADGVVTLYGTVHVPADKDRAAILALGIDGVRSVVNNLVVVRGS